MQLHGARVRGCLHDFIKRPSPRRRPAAAARSLRRSRPSGHPKYSAPGARWDWPAVCCNGTACANTGLLRNAAWSTLCGRACSAGSQSGAADSTCTSLTWSTVRSAQEAGRGDVLHAFADDMALAWGGAERRRPVAWPINMRMGRR